MKTLNSYGISIHDLVLKQNEYFETLETRDISFRTEKLKKLKKGILNREDEILTALKKDLGKNPQEAYMMEIRSVIEGINFSLKHIRRLARKKYVPTPLLQFGKSKILYEPYGTALIIAPFNYPFSLAIEPLTACLSAGNTAIVKPSELAPNVAKVVSTLLSEVFEYKYVASIEGDACITEELLQEKFDYIFFTGSQRIGKSVMTAAAKNLTPVTLELGGKSPVIIDSSADIHTAAKRIVWERLSITVKPVLPLTMY